MPQTDHSPHTRSSSRRGATRRIETGRPGYPGAGLDTPLRSYSTTELERRNFTAGTDHRDSTTAT